MIQATALLLRPRTMEIEKHSKSATTWSRDWDQCTTRNRALSVTKTRLPVVSARFQNSELATTTAAGTSCRQLLALTTATVCLVSLSQIVRLSISERLARASLQTQPRM